MTVNKLSQLDQLKDIYKIIPDSPGLLSGAILLSQAQYDVKIAALSRASMFTDSFTDSFTDELISAYKDQWEPIRITATDTMYRYRDATIPYTGRIYKPGDPIEEPDDIMDEWWNEHYRLSDEFSNQLQVALTGTFLIEADEDEDFTYGAFLQGIANLGMHADQWLLTREFGNYYSVRHIDTLLDK